MHEYGVIIGRFQPFHNAHLELVRFALKKAETLVIGIGSCNQSRDTRNPWSGFERAEMILSCLNSVERQRVRFAYLEDFYYNDLRWIAAVQKAIGQHVGTSKDVKLIGYEKDASSFYLRLFPQWGPHLEPHTNEEFVELSATRVRNAIFMKDNLVVKSLVPTTVYDFLQDWAKTDEFTRLAGEQHHIWDIEEEHRVLKHPPHFVTVDAVCICSGHVLVVRRGGKYGRGQIALPGGYLNTEETLERSCIRELKEETSIKMTQHDLQKLIIERDVFDHPLRDLRGRVITHAFKLQFPNGMLPKVKGSDDADRAWWMPLSEVDNNREKFFSDHWHIIDRFCGPQKNF